MGRVDFHRKVVKTDLSHLIPVVEKLSMNCLWKIRKAVINGAVTMRVAALIVAHSTPASSIENTAKPTFKTLDSSEFVTINGHR